MCQFLQGGNFIAHLHYYCLKRFSVAKPREIELIFQLILVLKKLSPAIAKNLESRAALLSHFWVKIRALVRGNLMALLALFGVALVTLL